MAPPSLYTPDRAVEVLCRLARGRSLQSVAGDPDMPSVTTIHDWARRDPVFAAHLQAARPRGPRNRAPGARRACLYTEALANGLCAALAEGFSLNAICASPAVPVKPGAVLAWVRTRPEFAAAYKAATRPRPTPRGLAIGRGRPGYTQERARAVIDRLIQGRSLADICRDPDMPSRLVLRLWRRRHMDFHLAMQAARRLQLDLLLDDVLAAADAGRTAGQARRIVAGLEQRGVLPYAAGPAWAEPPEEGAPGIGHNWRGR